MKAAYITGHGSADVVVYGERPLPQRRAGEVLVRVCAATLNRVDLYMRDSGAGITHTLPQIMGLDAVLGDLLTALDKAKIPYAVSLTADHGGHDIPERNRIQALPKAQRADRMLSAMAVGMILQKKHGLAASALLGRATFGDMYVAPDVPADKRQAILDEAVALYRAHPQVEAVFTKAELSAAPDPRSPVDEWTLMEEE